MSSIIKTHKHDNYDILKEFTESSGNLLYKGKPIIATSTHETENINTASGVHGLRYYSNKLQYYNGKWNDIATGGGTTVVDKDIIISPTANNALKKYSNGYFVQEFLISKQVNNALVKYSDGYYVPSIPANMATVEDVNTAKKELQDDIIEQEQIFNTRYDVITEKLKEIGANTTKNKVNKYTGNEASLSSVLDISTLYNLNSNVILNMEFMIINESTNDLLTLVIQENGIETLNNSLHKTEVQRYKLPNIVNLEIFIQGEYTLYLYVTYI